jgi:hypothetical protein
MKTIWALLALFLAAPAAAQTVRGVVEDDAARPVAGVLVALIPASGGAAAAGALTDAQGRFSLAAPAPGRWTVRAERVGYRAASAAVELAEGQAAEVRLVTGVQAFVLPPLQVSATRCTVRPGEDDAAYALWDEARKALATAALLHDQGRVEYTVRTYGSVISMSSGRTRRQNAEPRRVTGNPFRTLAPQALADGGYVRQDADSLSFYGPDAHALLSDAFLDTHCLYVDAERSDGERVALAFEPVGRRETVDIRGTLRLDRRTGELRDVEYEYTGLQADGQRVPAGGAVEFRRLPSGAWIVSRWRIRSTRLARGADWSRRGEQTAAITEIREAGGEVTNVEVRP